MLAYHQRTKHHFHGYARSPGYLDWATQPHPFRTYAGAPRVELPLTADGLKVAYCDLFQADRVQPSLLSLSTLGAFFELALGLTAWKEFQGSRWSLRSNPSSGNLHPTEGYALLPEADGLPAGVYHYVSRDHCLERRCTLAETTSDRLRDLIPAGCFVVGLSSIHWREAWKYGERAFRYCQHDIGHAIATVRYAAATLGWTAYLLDGFGDARVAAVLGLDRKEDFSAVDIQDREHPDVAILVSPGDASRSAKRMEDSADPLVQLVRKGSWAGRPNPLSPSHVQWNVIAEVAEATFKPASLASPGHARKAAAPLPSSCASPAATIIRQRRSAVSMDGVTSITRRQFYRMLDAVLPRSNVPPWDAVPWHPKIHLGLFVHRVEGLPSGLYLLERTAEVHDALTRVLGEEVRWDQPEECPEHLRLFCLRELDCRKAASTVSCHQDIAADGAFSLGMIAEYRDAVASGAYWYRRLFWEAGILGQVLYLEAEAAGVRATGIGCYFDDAFHEFLGLTDDRFQSLYHFTVGGPVEDTRLATHPPYAHREGS